MPLQPKDRTISMTLESTLINQKASRLQNPTQSFVSQFIPTNGLLGAVAKAVLGEDNTVLKLTGPTSIDFSYVADVAVEPGLFNTFIQPWYIKPVEIDIKGESYLGTYPLISRPDRDVEATLSKFLTTLREFSTRAGKPGTAERILLEIRNNPSNSRRFFGYLRRFNYGEAVTNPFILTYDIGFIGRPADDSAINDGKSRAGKLIQRAGGS